MVNEASQTFDRMVTYFPSYFQFEDPFYMPAWRKLLWSLFFFVMVAAADIGNIIGKHVNMKNVRRWKK